MATIDFPSSPTAGNLYVFGTRTWLWNGSGWQRVFNASQIVSVFTLLGPTVSIPVAFPYPIDGTWTLLNHI